MAAAGGAIGTEGVVLGKIRGLFECSYELVERYDQLGTFSLPLADSSLQQRSKGKFFLEEVAKQEAERMTALREAGQRRWKRDRDGDDGPGHFSGVPPLLREFLPRLPAHSGPIPDVEGFIRQLRAVVLPPRPADDGDFGSSSLKRGREEMTSSIVGSDWMQSGSGAVYLAFYFVFLIRYDMTVISTVSDYLLIIVSLHQHLLIYMVFSSLNIQIIFSIIIQY